MGGVLVCFEELKDKALSLPMAPGVYIMRDKSDNVIYVGKAKKLKNRVSQYFQETSSHSPKTRLMVSKIDHFEVIVAASEFEALVLECSLIKRYLPKYNILLKDDKGYPYIRLNMNEPYPRLSLAAKIEKDGAEYFGPFGSRGVTNDIIEALCQTLKLPTCRKEFPRDIGKDRPCLNYHMDQCAGWCQPGRGYNDYRDRMEQARQLLCGNFKHVANQIKAQMLQAADNLEFELAAGLRNRLSSVEALGQRQLVTAGSLADTDVIGYGETESKACFAVLHFSGGNLLDKDFEVFPRPDEPEAAVSALMKQYYLSRGFSPKRIFLPFNVEDIDLFSELLEREHGRKPTLKVPARGDNMRLVELANKNAYEEAQRLTTKEEKSKGTLMLLGKMLAMDPPTRIESYDISNLSGTDIVASMVVFREGKPLRSEYKKFKIKGLAGQDDYGAMREVLSRRFNHLLEQDKGFSDAPDLLLIDGGAIHAQTALEVLRGYDLNYPVFGMVKDDRHRTRALVTPDGKEVRIDSQQSVFALIGSIQEETHRFAINYHRNLRSNRLRYSALDGIAGVGPKRKHELLKVFKSIAAISAASTDELERYVPKNVAIEIFRHFHSDES